MTCLRPQISKVSPFFTLKSIRSRILSHKLEQKNIYSVSLVLLQVQGRLIIILGVFCPGEDFLPRFKLSLYICIRNVINIKLGSGVSRWSTVPVAKPYVFLPRKTSPNPCCYSSKNILVYFFDHFFFLFFSSRELLVLYFTNASSLVHYKWKSNEQVLFIFYGFVSFFFLYLLLSLHQNFNNLFLLPQLHFCLRLLS